MDEDIQRQILEELKNQTALFKKVNKVYIIVTIVFCILVVSVVAVTPFIHRMSSRLSVVPQSTDSWQEARSLLDKGEFHKAQGMLQRLIKAHADFYYGYTLLGSLNQELGNTKEAEANYAKAYDLFPTEENKKTLVAIRLVLKNKNIDANK